DAARSQLYTLSLHDALPISEPKETRWGYQYLNECLSGLALLRARALNAELVPMAVWDLQKGDGPGGTSGFVSFWHEKRRKVEIRSEEHTSELQSRSDLVCRL